MQLTNPFQADSIDALSEPTTL